MAKTWTEKMESGREPEIKRAPMDFAGIRRGQRMLIPTPRLVAECVRRIPSGSALDVRGLRERLAQENGAEVCCPMTTGIYLRIVAEAAFEQLEAGAGLDEVVPVWRVLDRSSPTLKKVSFDPQLVFEMRSREGIDD